MVRTCWAPGCRTGYDKKIENNPDGKRHFFNVPSDPTRRAHWNLNIPRKGILKTSHALCDLHFDEQYIVKTFDIIINGETIQIPRGRWKLTRDAIPTLFPNLPHYLSKKLPKQRHVLNRTLPAPTENKLQSVPVNELQSVPMNELQSVPVNKLQSVPVNELQSVPVNKLQSVPVNELQSVPVNKLQSVPVNELQSVPVNKLQSVPVNELQSVPVNKLHSAPENAPGRHFHQSVPVIKLHSIPISIKDEQRVLDNTHQQGEKNAENVSITHDAQKVFFKTERSKKPKCEKCKTTSTRVYRQNSMLRIKDGQIHYLREEVKQLTQENKQMKEKCTTFDRLSPKLKRILDQAVRNVEVKGNSGRRYSRELIEDCLQVKSQSLAMYKLLRKEESLPLPSISTLDNYIRKDKKSKLTSPDQ